VRIRSTVLASLAALSALGCAYDYDRIRDPDAFVDRALPRPDAGVEVVTADIPAPDTATTDVFDAPPTPDVQPDLVVMDVQPDIPTRPPRTGACDLPGVTSLAPGPSTSVGSSLVVTGSTVTARDTNARMTRLRPLVATSVGCANVSDSATVTRIFRYTVQSGPRVLATTNTGACSYVSGSVGGFDTVLYALPSCDMAGRTGALACSDDDNITLCRACATPARDGCRNLQSTVEISNQAPGDVIYFVVDEYMTPGNFTLAVAENGLLPATPPSLIPMGATLAPRCSCATTAPVTTTQTIPFPGGTFADDVMPFTGVGRAVRGLRPVSLRTISAVSATLRFRRVSFTLDGDCAMAVPRMTFDLFVNNVLMASFVVTPGTAAGVPVGVIYTAASPFARPASGTVPIEIRLREVTPNERCIQAELDTNPVNGSTVSAVTLVGEM
jgi:hypothetical protein